MTTSPASIKVLYVLGTQRGGSTIAGRVIATQPGFAFGGEVRRLWARGIGPGRACGCGRGFDTCPLWSKVLPEVLVDGVTADQVAGWQEEVAPRKHSWRHAERVLRASRPGARPWPALARYRSVMARMYTAMAGALGARVLVDASKLPADAAVMAGIAGIEPAVLHLVRDPRGVVHSQLRRQAPSGGIARARVVRLAAAWAVRHGAARRLARQCGAGWLELRYEDFVTEPGPALAQVAGLVGERPAPLPDDGRYDLVEVHTPGGRLPAESGVVLRRDDRWETDLPGPEMAVATIATLPWLLRFGYPLGRSSPG
ncbi:MAG TPA: hypothetical protein VHH09_07220 [Acidimicrobiales bacterium]|nr:hypothetical protein [Acidimicrobiales bacterium]